MAKARLRLIRLAARPKDEPDRTSWPLAVTAAGEGMTGEIFVYRVSQGGLHAGDTFEAVASAEELDSLPAGPGSAGEEGLYRASRAEFFCRSAWEESALWSQILEDADRLVRDLNSASLIADYQEDEPELQPMTLLLPGGQEVFLPDGRSVLIIPEQET